MTPHTRKAAPPRTARSKGFIARAIDRSEAPARRTAAFLVLEADHLTLLECKQLYTEGQRMAVGLRRKGRLSPEQNMALEEALRRFAKRFLNTRSQARSPR